MTLRKQITRKELSKKPKGFIVYDTRGEWGTYLRYHSTVNSEILFDESDDSYSTNDNGLYNFNEEGDGFYLPNEGEYGFEENKTLEPCK